MNWKGGKRVDPYGYVQIYRPEHHFANMGYVLEHRLVWELANNASLLPWTIVHHVNGDKTDNRIENLKPMKKSMHIGIHHKKDMSKRVCLKCNSNVSYDGKRHHWYCYDNGFICYKCYHKRYRVK